MKMNEKKFLTAKETAEYLDIPLQTLYQLTSNRKITYYQCGKRNYFDIDDIHAYITRHKVPAGSCKAGKRKRKGEGKEQIGFRIEEGNGGLNEQKD